MPAQTHTEEEGCLCTECRRARLLADEERWMLDAGQRLEEPTPAYVRDEARYRAALAARVEERAARLRQLLGGWLPPPDTRRIQLLLNKGSTKWPGAANVSATIDGYEVCVFRQGDQPWRTRTKKYSQRVFVRLGDRLVPAGRTRQVTQ